MTMVYVPAGVPPDGGVLLLLPPHEACSSINPAMNPSREPAIQRRRFRPAPMPKPSRLIPPIGSHVAYIGPPLNKLPVFTGRAVVLMFSVVVPGVPPERLTVVEVNVPVLAVGKPESLMEMAFA